MPLVLDALTKSAQKLYVYGVCCVTVYCASVCFKRKVVTNNFALRPLGCTGRNASSFLKDHLVSVGQIHATFLK